MHVALPALRNLAGGNTERGNRRIGTKRACFAVFGPGSLGVFPQKRGCWGHSGWEKGGGSGGKGHEGNRR